MEPLEHYGVHVLEEVPSRAVVQNKHIPDRCSPELEDAFQLMESQAEGLTVPDSELQELHQLLISLSNSQAALGLLRSSWSGRKTDLPIYQGSMIHSNTLAGA